MTRALLAVLAAPLLAAAPAPPAAPPARPAPPAKAAPAKPPSPPSPFEGTYSLDRKQFAEQARREIARLPPEQRVIAEAALEALGSVELTLVLEGQGRARITMRQAPDQPGAQPTEKNHQASWTAEEGGIVVRGEGAPDLRCKPAKEGLRCTQGGHAVLLVRSSP